MENLYTRTLLLLGEERMEKIKNSKIVLFGIGGVGSYVLESLIRAGVSRITIVDFDEITPSNRNRQLIALETNIGKLKVDEAEARIHSINSGVVVRKFPEKCTEENVSSFIEYDSTYVIDAIDDVNAKIAIISFCLENGIGVISSMGTGNRTRFEKYKISDISKTHGCPLARAMRKNLKKMGIKKGVKVLFSSEEPDIKAQNGVIGSISFVPAQAGLKIAEEVVNDIIK